VFHPIFSRVHRVSPGRVAALLVCAPLVCAPSLARCQAVCPGLPTSTELRSTLQSVVKEGSSKNGGMGNQEWAVIVNRKGIGCAVVFSGNTASDEWPASRVIAASKANTANGVSNNDYAISTANLYAASQPGGSLFGLITSGPPNPQAAFGDPSSFGTSNDPMIGKLVGGTIVFGGGLALYNRQGKIVGGLGVSGDTSCTDHIIAWKIRHMLHLDTVAMGPSSDHNDNMILDFKNGNSASGFGHPDCKGGTDPSYIIHSLSQKFPTGSGKT